MTWGCCCYSFKLNSQQLSFRLPMCVIRSLRKIICQELCPPWNHWQPCDHIELKVYGDMLRISV
jgi:hypothetical protein